MDVSYNAAGHDSEPGQKYGDLTRMYIARLPTELILIIFRVLYKNARTLSLSWYCANSDSDDPPKIPTDADYNWKKIKDIRTPDFFPLNVATVCRRWLSIATATPAYWSRIYVYVGRGATPVLAVKAFLEASDGPIEKLCITRRHDFDGHDPLERDRVMAVVALILPHLHRIRTLEFDVIHVDSLPTPCLDIHGAATQLTKFILHARRGTCGGRLRVPVRCTTKLECPALERVEADADVFFDAFARGGRSLMVAPRLWCLELRRTELHDEQHRFRRLSLDDLMLSLTVEDGPRHSHLRHVQLEGISFFPSKAQAPASPFTGSDLDLRGLTAAALSDTLAYAANNSSEYASIEGCGIENVVEGVDAYHFTLDNPPPGDDPLPFLRNVHTRTLCLMRCEGLTDSTLAGLSRGGPHDQDWTSPNLMELTITGCPNVTLARIRRFVKARLRAYQRNRRDTWDNFDQPVSRIEELIVSGCGQILEKDIQWLEANVDNFTLNGKEYSRRREY